MTHWNVCFFFGLKKNIQNIWHNKMYVTQINTYDTINTCHMTHYYTPHIPGRSPGIVSNIVYVCMYVCIVYVCTY